MRRRAPDRCTQRWRDLHELIVEARDRSPVRAAAVGALRVHGLNRSLELESAESGVARRRHQLALRFVDQRREPRVRILLGKRNELSLCAAPCRTARFAMEHQREEAVDFRQAVGRIHRTFAEKKQWFFKPWNVESVTDPKSDPRFRNAVFTAPTWKGYVREYARDLQDALLKVRK